MRLQLSSRELETISTALLVIKIPSEAEEKLCRKILSAYFKALTAERTQKPPSREPST